MRSPTKWTSLSLLALCGGCAGPIFGTSSPTLSELAGGGVHIAKLQARGGTDVYKTTYAVNAPVEVAWRTAADIPGWMRSARIVDEIWAMPQGGEDSASGRAGEEHYLVRWSNASTQKIVLRRDETKKMIDIAVAADSRATEQWGHCAVQIRPFLTDSSLVEAEVRVPRSGLSRVLDVFLTPATLIAGSSVEGRLESFWRDLAREHRRASEIAAQPDTPLSGRTHIIAIGVNALDDVEAWDRLRLEELRYAEKDAADFYRLANAAYPRDEADDRIIRRLLVGKRATSGDVGKALSEIMRSGPDAPVKAGDTVLLFYAGHIALEPDPLEPGDKGRGEQYPYLVTLNARPDNLRFTAIKRREVLEAMRRSAASRCVFFCDACYSGGRRVTSLAALQGDRTRVRGRRVALEEATGAAGSPMAVLAAAQYLGLAAESDDLEHGVFTHVVLEALRGAADTGGDGYVSIQELSDYVTRRVPEVSDAGQWPFVEVPATLAEMQWPVRE